ncbi:hypothetical protein MPL1_06079 [Methylophaga lonarensis MPL]|uniref:Uncharacterized protein n=1 Tax=Methylophaga lonarensis MPL TaxID=1286106 RepID=M7PH73_9GAMM|nr:hypothetical protein [Methylophaga lonarensis]EMR13240.1 hypothetical protein MPL1_06079 [Methylophaga lonarensis MPL]
MTKKWQELELRNIMQGLEEFATFISYRSHFGDMRVISVESVSSSDRQADNYHSADILAFRKKPADSQLNESPPLQQKIH